MTDIERNTRVVSRFFSLFSLDGLDEALSLMTDDATWQAVRVTDSPLTAPIGKEQWAAMLRHVLGELTAPISFEVRTVTAEADRVALEMAGTSHLPDGSVYRNLYMMLVELRDGLISAVREYQDTLQADAARSGLTVDG